MKWLDEVAEGFDERRGIVMERKVKIGTCTCVEGNIDDQGKTMIGCNSFAIIHFDGDAHDHLHFQCLACNRTYCRADRCAKQPRNKESLNAS